MKDSKHFIIDVKPFVSLSFSPILYESINRSREGESSNSLESSITLRKKKNEKGIKE
jgi:hypothetical protein